MTNTAETDSVRVVRRFGAPIETVFEAFTNSAIAALWMYGPNTHVSDYCLDSRV